MDIVNQRLAREFHVETIFTLPTVSYLVKTKQCRSIEKIESGYNIKEIIKEGYHKYIIPSNTNK